MFDEQGLTVKMIAQSLSSSERLVLSLHYGEGLTAREIADVMETQPKTVEELLDGVRERITAARLAILDSICG
ncbi:MAG: sigma-70 family RNA polymerase sigma factor [Phycisphaerae bacterium]|nr:sigma-70 family RNA polymerase sigma factor [Phycisphaerae bacterium]